MIVIHNNSCKEEDEIIAVIDLANHDCDCCNFPDEKPDISCECDATQDYSNQKFKYFNPIDFNKANLNFNYLRSDKQPHMIWSYGDTPKIRFELYKLKEYNNIPDIMYETEGAYRGVQVDIYNFRYEKILSKEFDKDDDVEFVIDKTTSENYFKILP